MLLCEIGMWARATPGFPRDYVSTRHDCENNDIVLIEYSAMSRTRHNREKNRIHQPAQPQGALQSHCIVKSFKIIIDLPGTPSSFGYSTNVANVRFDYPDTPRKDGNVSGGPLCKRRLLGIASGYAGNGAERLVRKHFLRRIHRQASIKPFMHEI